MYGLMINRIPAELDRIASALGVQKHIVAFQYLEYIFHSYLDEGTRQFSIYEFLTTETAMDKDKRFEEILKLLEDDVCLGGETTGVKLGTSEARRIVLALGGGNKQSALAPYYQELFQSGLRAMLTALNGLHDALQVSMESAQIKFRMYQSHFIVEYDTTGTIFSDHDEVIEVAVKSLSELEYF